MDKSTIVDKKNVTKINKYIYQAITKFDDFRRKSPVTLFDISLSDLSNETYNQLNIYIADCKSAGEIHRKLNGIMTEVIALIYKQSESLILSNIKYEDTSWVKKAINEIRERIRNRWDLT
jgi:hypothetical protein